MTTTGLFLLALTLTGPVAKGPVAKGPATSGPVAAGPVAQRGLEESTAPGVKVSHCVVTLIGEMRVPAQTPGVLKSLTPHEGEVVLKEKVIARIDDRDAERRMNIAKFEFLSADQQAKNDVRVRAADASAKVAAANFLKSTKINEKSPGAISDTEILRLELERDHAVLQIELANLEYQVSGSTRDAKQAQFALAEQEYKNCQITAPWDGVVVERYRREGEWLQQGEPILRMVQMDKLRVEGFLKLADFSPLEVDGADVIVEFQLSRGRVERRPSTIAFVSPQVDAGEFRVWAYIDNTLETNARGKQQWLLRPGMIADMTIVLDNPKATVAQK
jgi:macrolide-specific efflux system membrane fusion protein